jgi:hypothetical protein
VILERERGTSWGEIGEELSATTKQAAQQRFGGVVEEWLAALDEPLVRGRGGIYDCRLPDGADSPERCVARLDAWVKRHDNPTDPPRSVSAERADLVEQVAQLDRAARRISGENDPAKRRAFFEHKARVMRNIAEAQPGNVDALEAAADAAAQLAKMNQST